MIGEGGAPRQRQKFNEITWHRAHEDTAQPSMLSLLNLSKEGPSAWRLQAPCACSPRY